MNLLFMIYLLCENSNCNSMPLNEFWELHKKPKEEQTWLGMMKLFFTTSIR